MEVIIAKGGSGESWPVAGQVAVVVVAVVLAIVMITGLVKRNRK
ncbi:hypothetical protein [Streptomyces sp. NPDC051214]